jgi:hypothetical protein
VVRVSVFAAFGRATLAGQRSVRCGSLVLS